MVICLRFVCRPELMDLMLPTLQLPTFLMFVAYLSQIYRPKALIGDMVKDKNGLMVLTLRFATT